MRLLETCKTDQLITTGDRTCSTRVQVLVVQGTAKDGESTDVSDAGSERTLVQKYLYFGMGIESKLCMVAFGDAVEVGTW